MPARTPEEIRASIETNRAELALSVGRLRGEVERLRGEVERYTDWRAHLARHSRQLLIGAAVTGCALAGIGFLRRRR